MVCLPVDPRRRRDEGDSPTAGVRSDRYCAVVGKSDLVGAGDSWALEVRDATGKITRMIVLHEPRRPVTAALRDSVRVRDLRQIAMMQGADEQMKATVRASLEQERFADSVAPYDDALEGRDGSLWVSATALPTDSGPLVRRVRQGRTPHPAGTASRAERVLAVDGASCWCGV